MTRVGVKPFPAGRYDVLNDRTLTVAADGSGTERNQHEQVLATYGPEMVRMVLGFHGFTHYVPEAQA